MSCPHCGDWSDDIVAPYCLECWNSGLLPETAMSYSMMAAKAAREEAEAEAETAEINEAKWEAFWAAKKADTDTDTDTDNNGATS